MKQVFLFFLLCLCFAGYAQTEVSGSLKADIVQKEEMGYVLHVPASIKEKKPLLVFMHGDGEKGTDIEKVKIHGPFTYLKTHTLDAYVLAPQCRENQLWNSEIIYQLIKKIIKENNIDTDRIYLTGLSSGGWATWDLAFAHPDFFAALVPIASFTDLLREDEACHLKNIPIRMFHGVLDDVVPMSYPASIYKAVKACGGNITLTLFDDANHNSWTRVYESPEIYEWLFKQTKKPNVN
ncbi:MAG: Carbohydrate esterase family 1 [Bacteroidota bacterium]|jgi:predicted peptidase